MVVVSSRGKDFKQRCKSCKGTGFVPLQRIKCILARTHAELMACSPELFAKAIDELEKVAASLKDAQEVLSAPPP